MERRPRLLDLFCGAGGAAKGYQEAGFYVVGVDVSPQPNYCGDFFSQDDAIGRLEWLVDLVERNGSCQYDAIHASPPCQAFTKAQRLQGNEHPDLVTPVRNLLERTRLPWVIENVEGAPLLVPVTLCGAMFVEELRTYRHRQFETNWPLVQPTHLAHDYPTTKMGRPPKDGEFMHIVGHFSGADEGREAMGIPWMTKRELAEAIPPAYTEYVGLQLRSHLLLERAA